MGKSCNKETSPQAIQRALSRLPAYRIGLPTRDVITAVTTAGKFMIIHTQEVDGGLGIAAVPELPTSEDYMGTARRHAKMSISAARIETFKDVKDLVESLVPDVQTLQLKIETASTSKRVKEEERNVHVTAFIYAACRETDNDFHLIIGRDPKATPEIYMRMVVSGLPKSTNASFKQLKAVRDGFTKFFNDYVGDQLPGLTYDYYDPVIPVQIDGSLFCTKSHTAWLSFFDRTDVSRGRPGPPSLSSHLPISWEVHPITKIEFKP